MKNTIVRGIILFLLAGLMPMSCSAADTKADEKSNNAAAAENFLVTFVELGSVRCIPCKMMQPIMKEIEKEYAGQVKVVFHDVWTPEGEPFAGKFNIRLIPTQVFLDRNGKEFHRHMGFYAYEEIAPVLKKAGL